MQACFLGDTAAHMRTPVKRNTPFGQWLSENRQRRGLTMESLADASDITQAMVSNMERGTRNPSRETIAKLSYALSPLGADEHTARSLLNAGLKAAGFASADNDFDDHEVIDYLRGQPEAVQDKALRMLKAAFDEEDAKDNAGNIGRKAE